MSADRLELLDYYTLLRIEEDVTTDAVQAAFHTFALRYHPDNFAGAPEEKQARAAQIYRRGAEAYRILSDSRRRRLYDQGLSKGQLRLSAQEERRAPKVTAKGGIPQVRSPRARPFVTKAMQALKKGDLKQAKFNFKMALSHEPTNASLRARLEEVEGRLKKG